MGYMVMMKATATELNKHPGKYIDQAIKEPVVIEKSGRPTDVMVEYDHYIKLEDSYWGEEAILADQERALSVKKTMDFLLSEDECHKLD